MAPKAAQSKLKAMATNSPSQKRKRSSPDPSSSESESQCSPGSSSSSGEEEETETSTDLQQNQNQKQVLASATNDNINEESSEGEDEDEDDGGDEDQQQKQEAAAVVAESAKREAVTVSAKKAYQSVASSGSSAAAWKKEDEEVLLQALDEHHKNYGKLPSQSRYVAMLPAVQNRLSFAATATQIYNKVRSFKTAHSKLLSMTMASKPLTEEQTQRFRLWCKWFRNDTDKDKAGDEEDDNISTNYSCICKILEEAGKKGQLSELLACANPDTIAKLIGPMQAGELEARLKKFKRGQMKMKAREMKLHSEVVDVFVRAIAKS